jgi:hypothetical protein
MSRSVTPVPYPTPLQSAPSRSRTMPLPVEVIEILDSDNEDCSIPARPMQLKREHEPSPEIPGNVSQCMKSHPSKHKKAEDTVKITKKVSVDEIEILDTVLTTWTVPRTSTAYLVDFSTMPVPERRNGDEYTLDAFVRSEICGLVHEPFITHLMIDIGPRILGGFNWP